MQDIVTAQQKLPQFLIEYIHCLLQNPESPHKMVSFNVIEKHTQYNA